LPAPLPEAENRVCHDYCEKSCPSVFDGSDPGACIAPSRLAAANVTANAFGHVHQETKRSRQVKRVSGSRAKAKTSNTVCSALVEHANKACESEAKQVGVFETPLECLQSAKNDATCGDHIMFAPSYKNWGCRCCSRGTGFVNHDLWQILRLSCQEVPVETPRLRGQQKLDTGPAGNDPEVVKAKAMQAMTGALQDLQESTAGSKEGAAENSTNSTGKEDNLPGKDDDPADNATADNATASCFWRQTGSCNANGAREPENDQPCDVVIEPGKSGYCECYDESGSTFRGYETDCRGTFSFTCDIACAGPEICMWRQTGACDPSGPREPANDKTCGTKIAAGWSGY